MGIWQSSKGFPVATYVEDVKASLDTVVLRFELLSFQLRSTHAHGSSSNLLQSTGTLRTQQLRNTLF